MSGGGSNPLKDIGDTISKGVQTVGNYYGFDNSGKWTNSGGVFKWADEGIGEVTGRNQSRAALNLGRDQFNQANQQAQNLVNQQEWNRQQGDILASNQAGAARSSAKAAGGINYGNATPMAMGPGFGGAGSSGAGKDFLGL
jgi:hypothetical protein